jgi:hypothetical protein
VVPSDGRGGIPKVRLIFEQEPLRHPHPALIEAAESAPPVSYRQGFVIGLQLKQRKPPAKKTSRRFVQMPPLNDVAAS